jgi:TatD DNase family protein
MFIDSHAHLESADFDIDRSSMLERARSAQVERILGICSGTGPTALSAAIKLAEENNDVDAAIGIHPHEASLARSEDFELLKKLAEHPKVVAWGEIGLDFHYDHSPRQTQRAVFVRQLALAKSSELPVIIHTREAEEETLQILKEDWGKNELGGILHCFTGSLKMAEECLELGFLVSFSGMLTFPKAQAVRDVAQEIPLEKLLIETDSPYLAPIPFRGKRNEPAYVVETAKALGELKGLSTDAVGQITAENYRRLFKAH